MKRRTRETAQAYLTMAFCFVGMYILHTVSDMVKAWDEHTMGPVPIELHFVIYAAFITAIGGFACFIWWVETQKPEEEEVD